jgi:hypothetical protein
MNRSYPKWVGSLACASLGGVGQPGRGSLRWKVAVTGLSVEPEPRFPRH